MCAFEIPVGDGAKRDFSPEQKGTGLCLEAESPKNRRLSGFRRVLESPEFDVWMVHDGDELPFGG